MPQQHTNYNHLPDTQNNKDNRGIEINKVGIKDIKIPFNFIDEGKNQSTIGNFSMTSSLDASLKGTHMSRFVEILNTKDVTFSYSTFDDLLKKVLERMESKKVFIEVDFLFFINKKAPISKIESLLDYSIKISGKAEKDSVNNIIFDKTITLIVPVTSLCPCSKNISDYGAHNQKSNITVDIKSNNLSITKIIVMLEKQASCDLYGVLKRVDEKYVTEKAYDNPVFVEDIVRNVANGFDKEKDISYYRVQSENFESIHNHSAYAMVERNKNNI